MIRFIICFVIVILIYHALILIIYNKCTGEDERLKIPRMLGSKISGTGLSKKLGFPTVNVKLDKPIPCGYYDANSNHGPATVVVGKFDQNKALINFMNFKPEIDKIDRFELWDLNRIVRTDNDIIRTFNRGCCI